MCKPLVPTGLSNVILTESIKSSGGTTAHNIKVLTIKMSQTKMKGKHPHTGNSKISDKESSKLGQ
jgi:hypothetical protein